MPEKVIDTFLLRGKLAKIQETKIGVRILLDTADKNRLVIECANQPNLRVGDLVEGSG